MSSALFRVVGPNLSLRIITLDDAAYVHGLRSNPAYNAHLSAIHGAVADQIEWIRAYKMREEMGEELYYIVTRNDGTRCGTVRLYHIRDASFTWGSWILDQNKPPKAALESALLSFGVGFEQLGSAYARIEVQCSNTHAIAFYRRFRMTEIERTPQEMSFTYTRERFLADRDEYLAILNEPAEL